MMKIDLSSIISYVSECTENGVLLVQNMNGISISLFCSSVRQQNSVWLYDLQKVY